MVLNLCTWFTQQCYGDFLFFVVSLSYAENHVFQLMLVKACKLYSMPVEFVLLFFFMYSITIHTSFADWPCGLSCKDFLLLPLCLKMGMVRDFKEKFEYMFEKKVCLPLEQIRLKGSVSCAVLFYIFCSCSEDQSFF
jgi:hypothetical protein